MFDVIVGNQKFDNFKFFIYKSDSLLDFLTTKVFYLLKVNIPL